MRLFSWVTIGLLAAAWISVKTAAAADSPQLAALRQKVKTLQALVDEGAAPRSRLIEAQEEIADAEDDALVMAGLRNPELTEAEAEDMLAAAKRRVERHEQALEKGRQAVAAGWGIEANLGPLATDLDFSRKEYALAEEHAEITRQLTAMAQSEALAVRGLDNARGHGTLANGSAEFFEGNGRFTSEILGRVETAYQNRFGKPLPISAIGETAVHRALGFDHTGRVDVAVHPDQPEGVWLRGFLEQNQIPYFAFRQAVPGQATGAHIHLGPPSTRLAPGNAAGPDAAGSRVSAAE
jgi:hypothetical protein